MPASTSALSSRFPGPRLAGTAFVVAPLLLVAGAIGLVPFEGGDVADQLRQIDASPTRTFVGLNVFFAGWVLGAVAIVAFAQLVAVRRPILAAWGAVLALAGTYVSGFFAGVSYYETILAGIPDRALALEIATRGGTPPPAVGVAALGLVFGWFVLGFAAWRSGVLGPARAAALAVTGTLPFWVLGGVPYLMPVPYVGMAIAWVPLGVELLRARPVDPVAPRGEAA